MILKQANYEIIINRNGDPLIIRDVGPWNIYPSITNDAEGVVQRLTMAGLLPNGRRLLYYDSEGILDEIVIKDGKFSYFQILEEG